MNKPFQGEVSHVWASEPSCIDDPNVFPPETLSEVAFIGRSNVGKSSLINALMRRNKLARTSSNPGATKMLHFYEIPHSFILVDLPGYGYAKISKTQSAEIARLSEKYFSERRTLKQVFVLVDSRRGLKEIDISILNILAEFGVPSQVIFTKIDKTRPAELQGNLVKAQEIISQIVGVDATILTTSSEKKIGLEEVKSAISLACGV